MEWRAPAALPASSARCDIPIVDAAQLNASVLSAYYSEPLLVRGGAASWPALHTWRRSIMLQTWGDLLVQLAPNGERVPLRDFLDEMQQPNATAPPRFVFQPLTWDWERTARPGLKWSHVEVDIELPTFLSGWRRDGEGVRDLGNWFLSVGATSSGQHFHSHGEALNAVVWGRKRWFFLAPGSSVRASDYASSLEFARGLPEFRREGASVAECVQERGDVVILPAQLPHAVVNDGDTVSVSLDRV